MENLIFCAVSPTKSKTSLKLTFYKLLLSTTINRSSHPKVLCKKGVLRNFKKFTGKHLYQSLLFNKVTGLRSATLLKKRLWYSVFL